MVEKSIITLESAAAYLQENKSDLSEITLFQAVTLLQVVREREITLNRAFTFFERFVVEGEAGYSDYQKSLKKASDFLKAHAGYLGLVVE